MHLEADSCMLETHGNMSFLRCKGPSPCPKNASFAPLALRITSPRFVSSAPAQLARGGTTLTDPTKRWRKKKRRRKAGPPHSRTTHDTDTAAMWGTATARTYSTRTHSPRLCPSAFFFFFCKKTPPHHHHPVPPLLLMMEVTQNHLTGIPFNSC